MLLAENATHVSSANKTMLQMEDIKYLNIKYVINK